MAITYGLGFDPFWYIADNYGKPLAGGKMWTYDNETLQPKFIYKDPAGQNPWENPLTFNENGQQGPFYFAFDPAVPADKYYIEVYDANNNLVWDIADYLPPSGGGGGGGTSVFNGTNLIVNNVFWRNTGNTASPVPNAYTLIAPGCHAGLALTSNNAGPDIVFLKNDLTATDQITFPNTPQGTQPFGTDVAPIQYFNYTCGTPGGSEITKCLQFPIIAKVGNLSNKQVTISLWMRSTGSIKSLVLKWRTYYGDAAIPVESIIPFFTCTPLAAGTWQKFSTSATVPSVVGATLGNCGNDALFLQIQFPLSETCNIDLALPALYVGALAPSNSFILYDQIDGMINVPRTGQVRPSYDLSAPLGWVLMNDGSIGSAASGGTTRANVDTFPLYNFLYTNVSDTWAPVSGGRSGSAVTDFLANKTLTLPRALGRAMAEAGSGVGLTARALGQFLGEETHTQTIAEMPSHNHPPQSGSFDVMIGAGGSSNFVAGTQNTVQATTGNTGGGTPFNVMQPTTFMNFIIKL